LIGADFFIWSRWFMNMNMNPTKMKQKTPENKIIGKIGV
jgi:hypothetical protein